MTEDDIEAPPMLATTGAERWTAKKAPKNGVGTWATLVQISSARERVEVEDIVVDRDQGEWRRRREPIAHERDARSAGQ